jgi:aquaporin Z
MKKYLAEGIGTFGLVFAGTGSVVVNSVTPGDPLGLVGISIVFGLAVMTMIYAVGDVSGAHINPAVTLALWVGRRLPGKEVLPYIVAQCIGAVLASLCLHLAFPMEEALGGTAPRGQLLFESFAFEIVLTFLLMFVIMGFVTGSGDKGLIAGAAIGAVVCMNVFVGGPISGASMNPARSLGPALVSGNMASLWIYMTAPVIGAVIAVVASRFVHGPPAAQED